MYYEGLDTSALSNFDGDDLAAQGVKLKYFLDICLVLRLRKSPVLAFYTDRLLR